MNMQGVIVPVGAEEEPRGTRLERTAQWLRDRRYFLYIVVAPTLVLAAYLYLIASDQYESEAHFIVRSVDMAQMPGTGVSEALSMVTGASAGQNEAISVADYLTSHDVVATLAKEDDLVARFHRPDVDFFSRLRQASPTPERLLRYYQKQVNVRYNTETGITTLTVHSFRPNDSYQLVRKLLQLGEQRVNFLNTRSYEDSIAMSRRQLAGAEQALGVVQAQLTNFRQRRGDIDPQASGAAQIGLVSTMTGQLAAARAQLSAMGRMISSSSPQYQAMAARVRALETQVNAQSGRLTGNERAIAADLSSYQNLQVRQQFLAKRYEAAAASLEKARETALRQQLYLVRVVDANMPVKALFPQRARILLTTLIALLLVYSIGWLIVAGVREHAA